MSRKTEANNAYNHIKMGILLWERVDRAEESTGQQQEDHSRAGPHNQVEEAYKHVSKRKQCSLLISVLSCICACQILVLKKEAYLALMPCRCAL